ncbi:uncharacterized protein LOC115114582 isoform X5 [Oncorhynchus nerka]|uniref:uncharacterized protein LOC115114582 isoform X5 n=1 Tax=Oncorhynchus nerka TaxID=8023 RepID=UPI0031B8ABEF
MRKRQAPEDFLGKGPDRKVFMGNDELTRLCNLNHNNMAACQSVSRPVQWCQERSCRVKCSGSILSTHLHAPSCRVVRNSNWLASHASCLGVPTSSSPAAWLTTWRAWSSNWPRSCLRTSRLRRLRQENTMATPFSKRAMTVPNGRPWLDSWR